MTKGILGKKVGMTQFFTETGELVPVTVIEAQPNVVLQAKTNETDGYEAIQVGFDDKREVLANKPHKGHVAKAETTPKRFIKEFKDVELGDYEVGSEIKVGPMSHGSRYHRSPGSMGMASDASKVFKGKNLPGQTGGTQITIQNLEIVKVDAERNVILIKGNVPGAKKSMVTIKSAVKSAE